MIESFGASSGSASLDIDLDDMAESFLLIHSSIRFLLFHIL